jgi:large subunit ribosomal protein L15
MKRKKVVKMRGSKTHGYGSKKKHRGAGSRGGRGYAGITKHKKIWLLKHDPEHLGKRGFKSLRQRKLIPKPKAINLRDLEKLIGNKKEINLKELGYDKVLGSGKIKKSLIIKAKSFSKKAIAKIEKAKGKAVIVT